MCLGNYHLNHRLIITTYDIWQSTYDNSLCDDLIHAAVLTKPGFKLLKEEVVAHVREQLAPHKHITGDVLFVEHIPHNPQGKKLRKTLRDLYIAGKLTRSE